jgi:hypothetical protein
MNMFSGAKGLALAQMVAGHVARWGSARGCGGPYPEGFAAQTRSDESQPRYSGPQFGPITRELLKPQPRSDEAQRRAGEQLRSQAALQGRDERAAYRNLFLSGDLGAEVNRVLKGWSRGGA